MSDTATSPPEEWARVEIMGHRQHYGRISEAERFGSKMLRVDVPTEDPDVYETHFYGGASIFGITPTTEATARAYASRYRPAPYTPVNALPPPRDLFGEELDEANQDDE